MLPTVTYKPKLTSTVSIKSPEEKKLSGHARVSTGKQRPDDESTKIRIVRLTSAIECLEVTV